MKCVDLIFPNQLLVSNGPSINNKKLSRIDKFQYNLANWSGKLRNFYFDLKKSESENLLRLSYFWEEFSGRTLQRQNVFNPKWLF